MIQVPDSQTAILLLIRHGATKINLENPPRLQGREPDVPLSPTGEQQAQQTARFLAPWPVAAVYSSPLLRARQTAQRIAQPHGLEVEVVEAIAECDLGHWAGLTWPEIMERDGDYYRRFLESPETIGYRGGENLTQVLQRTAPALERIGRNHTGQVVAVVAHNIVLRAYFCHLLGLPLKQWRAITQDNCGVNVVRWQARKTKLITLNAVFHLSAVEPPDAVGPAPSASRPAPEASRDGK